MRVNRVAAPGLTRRFLLKCAAMIPAASLGRRAFAAQPSTDISSQDFLQLSKFLVGRAHLDEIVAGRALSGLTTNDPDFPEKASALWAALRAENFADMSRFNEFSTRHPEMRATSIAIISAWYLGYCGKYDGHAVPAVGHPVDNAQYVAYAAALMYAPTIDATVIPSYSRGRTNYWFYPPKTIARD